jgi:hypothetical protein
LKQEEENQVGVKGENRAYLRTVLGDIICINESLFISQLQSNIHIPKLGQIERMPCFYIFFVEVRPMIITTQLKPIFPIILDKTPNKFQLDFNWR